MSFIVYDVVFMFLFTLLVIIFLYKKRKNLKRQGILYLYPTQIGVKFIDRFTKKYERFLRPLEYVIIFSGYILMIIAVYMIYKLAYIYFSVPSAAADIKVPVLMPLIPYLPELFDIPYLPSFPFTYWIIIIAIIAIPHEFAHGIFARLNKIKVKSTGFGFLGPFLAAFVEPDEKQMEKSSRTGQLAILAAGTFANVISTIIFMALVWIFFAMAFTPTGVYFNVPYSGIVNISEVTLSNGLVPSSILLMNNTDSKVVELRYKNTTYLVSYETLKTSLIRNNSLVYVFDNYPAFRAGMTSGAIIKVDGDKISSYETLREIISKKTPGENITLTVKTGKDVQDYKLTLADKEGKSVLGVSKSDLSQIRGNSFYSRALLGIYKSFLATDPLKYQREVNGLVYETTLGDFGMFIYNLFWWIVIICFSVAVMNMSPVGIFDGGRFFYLSVEGLTKSKKAAEIAYKVSTWLFIAIVIGMMGKWLIMVLF